MKLEIDIVVCKDNFRLDSKIANIVIKLGNLSKLSLSYTPVPILNFNKFKRSPERIIREINKGIHSIVFESSNTITVLSFWSGFDSIETHHIFWIDEEDLSKLKLRKDQRAIVNGELGRKKVKYTVKKPSREKSQMEYRKRAYYGKCKK
jgi:hypothetical protein